MPDTLPDGTDAEKPTVVRRGYRFAIIPEWILHHPTLSDRAVRLFAVLDRYANDDGTCWPSRVTLAAKMGCSVDSLDRAKAELVDAGALEVVHRTGADGAPTSNLYILNGEPPGVAAPLRLPSRDAAAGGSRAGAAQRRVTSESESKNDDDTSPVTQTAPADGPSSSEVWKRYAERVADRRPSPPDNRQAFVTDVARKAGRERDSELVALRQLHPQASADELADLLASDGTPAPVSPYKPNPPAPMDCTLCGAPFPSMDAMLDHQESDCPKAEHHEPPPDLDELREKLRRKRGAG